MPVHSDTIALGSAAPDFALASSEGTEIKLSDYRGRSVVLVFLRGFS